MWQPLWLILQLSVQTITMVAVNPLFWLTLWFAYRYYRQYEWDKASARRLALASFWEGLLAGLFVVWLVAGLGIRTIPSPALYCMGPVSMLLSLIRPRFLCMAYGAGITLGLGRVLGLPVDAPGIMALVAILHLAEGLLVLLFGGRHTVTIYQQRQRRLVPVSGIYRFWPVPVCLLISGKQWLDLAQLSMPGWWPLLKTAPDAMQQAVLGLLPIAVTLGYSDLSGEKEQVKRRHLQNGILIALYALLLLGISLLAENHPLWGDIGLVFMVGGHEMIVKGRSWRRHA